MLTIEENEFDKGKQYQFTGSDGTFLGYFYDDKLSLYCKEQISPHELELIKSFIAELALLDL